jgi:hypothetical protein
MEKKPGKKFDLNELAASIVDKATDETPTEPSNKNPAAVVLGRLGGLKGGKARADKLSPEKRSEIAKKAAQARWKKG